jgi:hypothetical protein
MKICMFRQNWPNPSSFRDDNASIRGWRDRPGRLLALRAAHTVCEGKLPYHPHQVLDDLQAQHRKYGAVQLPSRDLRGREGCYGNSPQSPFRKRTKMTRMKVKLQW